MNLKSYETELKRGTIVIAVLSKLKTPTYGYELSVQLNAAGYDIEQTTLYPLLRRLELNGILTSSWDNLDARKKKYYTITNDGLILYQDLLEQWKKTNIILEAMTNENN